MMGSRGVSRPMAEQEIREHQSESGNDHGGGHEMSRADRLSMLRMHHRQTLWIYWTLPPQRVLGTVKIVRTPGRKND